MFLDVLLMFLLLVVILVVFNVLKVFVFDKVHINKWLILLAAVLFAVLPGVLNLPQGRYWTLLYMPFSIIPALWFVNLMFFAKKDVKEVKKIKIKPKAKPNRVKNNHK
ncbi:MAG: hypothetical protein Q8930_07270 [Bacillota bacterium]|nr:hypothetical protein [Bacillota bacterium]